jgi:ribonuclease HIII
MNMATKTILVDDETLKKVLYFYDDYKIENKNPHALMMAKSNNTTITVFKSKKVLFQGENADAEAQIFEGKTIEKKVKENKSTNQVEPTNYYLTSIGSDEVGTGDYFGPVVVCAAYVDDASIQKIKDLKIDDSKKLTDQIILKVAPTLFDILPYSLLCISNEKYNDVMQNMNLNQMKALLHKQAITHLIKKINHKPEIVIDQFCSIKNFNQYTKDTQFLNTVIFTTKAESKYLSVACASIMARYKFLKEMDRLSEEVGTILLKGASSQVDQQAKYLIKQHGVQILNKIAKKHFKNTDKVLNS